jgi:hypothetical protein
MHPIENQKLYWFISLQNVLLIRPNLISLSCENIFLNDMKTFPPNRFLALIFFAGFLASFSPQLFAQTPIPDPETFFGFKPGTDRMLFDYEKMISYFQKLDEASPKVKIAEIGTSPMGKKMYIVFISSEENINRLDDLRNINEQLALNPDIKPSEREEMIKNGKVFLLCTLSMHSDEVGPSQASPLIAYDLALTQDKGKLELLSNVVLMIVPNHNPDGMDMVVNNYLKYKGTKYEGGSLPAVYHKYAGHDNNRDFVTLSQQDTKAIDAIFSKTWFPQVMIEKHQMGSNGPRYYVPPSHDPVSENVDAELWNWTWIFGSGMAKDMINAGLKGVSQEYLFDMYWPGSTETCIWKNVIGLLTECASAGVATPIYTEFNELSVIGKGLGDYKKSINMTEPWPGGWWKLSDIVKYEIVSTFSLMKTSSQNKEELLAFRNDICKREVELGKEKPPYFYLLPLDQHDVSELVSLINLLDDHGVKIYRLIEDVVLESRLFRKGDIVVPLAQPFRGFIKEVMEKQVYPVRHYVPNGEIIKPYDVASWSLPLHKGLESIEINKPGLSLKRQCESLNFPFTLAGSKNSSGSQLFFTVNNNESFRVAFRALGLGLKVMRTLESDTVAGVVLPVGSFMIIPGPKTNELLQGVITVDPVISTSDVRVKMKPLLMPRIGLVETNMHDMDAGWTRFIFDSYSIPFTVVRPGDFAKLKPSEKFEILIFPDNSKSVLMEGKYKAGADYYPTDYPPEFTKGIGKEGFEVILKFLNIGGKIISWGSSIDLFTGQLSIKVSDTEQDEFQLPFTNAAETAGKEGLFCPGSLLEINLSPGNPLSLGMKNKTAGFFLGNAVLSTSQPIFDTDRRVFGSFPETNILLSGYIEKEEKLANRPALVWIKKGSGQLVLFAFDPIFRASVPVTYKLLFNALLME